MCSGGLPLCALTPALQWVRMGWALALVGRRTRQSGLPTWPTDPQRWTGQGPVQGTVGAPVRVGAQ